ncbi:MAG: helix-turn-helix transcriptional regulator [Frankiaceae bacterium]
MQACDLRNFLAPCLLLLLAERSDHGYDLVTRLRPLVDVDGDAGAVYRTLRHLERDGLVESTWLPANGAPARRSYQLTDEGRARLRECVVDIRQLRDTLDRFLFRQRSLPELSLRGRRS